MNATSLALKYIDCGHYRLTDHQARVLSPTDLAGVVLLTRPSHEGGKWTPSRVVATQARTAEVLRTPLGWHDGEPVNRGWTWALHLS